MLVVLIAVACVAMGCGRSKPLPEATAGGGSDAGLDGALAGSDGTADGSGDSSRVVLLGSPLIFAPTPHGFGLNAVLRTGAPSALQARLREEAGPATAGWTELERPSSPAPDVAQWTVAELTPGRRYQYEIRATPAPDDQQGGPLFVGSVVTAPGPGSSFTFAVLGDSHIAPRDPLPRDGDIDPGINGFQEMMLEDVAADVREGDPDFVMNLGDTLDFHRFGFNVPPPDASWTRLGYLNYRRLLGNTLGRAAHFRVIGNWDGENGCNTAEEIQRSSSQRLIYVPGPAQDTYPEGGSAREDYYAFTWGDALFVVLNVMTYTPTCHLLGYAPGLPDDWTLGVDQLAWLERTLAGAAVRWRFLFIHHAVGGAAGNSADSAYGRGGGQAAHVGEQAIVHDLMLRHGVQVFFYGHDHVFTDIVVDDIHYTLPGSAGAPWKFDASETGYTRYWPDSGHGRVTVSPTRTLIEFVAVGNRVLSSFALE